MTECEVEEMPLDEYYTALFKPDRSVEYTQLHGVPRAAYLSKRFGRKRDRISALEAKRKKELGGMLDIGPKLEVTMNESIAATKQIVQNLHKELFECEETIKYTERLNRGLKEDTEINKDKIRELTAIVEALDQEIEKVKVSSQQDFCGGDDLDSKLKIKENMIQRIMVAHRRLVEDYKRKKQLYTMTDDKLRSSIPENRVLLMDAYESLRKAKWSLRDMNSSIEAAEVPSTSQKELEHALLIAKTSLSLNQNIVATAAQKCVNKQKEIDRLLEQLDTYKVSRDVYAENSKCVPHIVKAENTGRLLFEFILKAKIQVKECFDAIRKREEYLDDLRKKHNLGLKHAHVEGRQRLQRARSAGGYSMMARHSPAVRERRLSVSDQYLQGQVMLKLLNQAADSNQDYAKEDLTRFHGESMIEEPTLIEAFTGDTTTRDLPAVESEIVFAAPPSPIRPTMADTTIRTLPSEESVTVCARSSTPINQTIAGSSKYGTIVRREPKIQRRRADFPTAETSINLSSLDTTTRNLSLEQQIAALSAAPSTPIQQNIAGSGRYGNIVRREPKILRRRSEFPTGDILLPSPGDIPLPSPGDIPLPSPDTTVRSMPVQEVPTVCEAPTPGRGIYRNIVRRQPKGQRKRTEFATGEFAFKPPSPETLRKMGY